MWPRQGLWHGKRAAETETWHILSLLTNKIKKASRTPKQLPEQSSKFLDDFFANFLFLNNQKRHFCLREQLCACSKTRQNWVTFEVFWLISLYATIKLIPNQNLERQVTIYIPNTSKTLLTHSSSTHRTEHSFFASISCRKSPLLQQESISISNFLNSFSITALSHGFLAGCAQSWIVPILYSNPLQKFLPLPPLITELTCVEVLS